MGATISNWRPPLNTYPYRGCNDGIITIANCGSSPLMWYDQLHVLNLDELINHYDGLLTVTVKPT